jgi:hypothetical protein
MMPMITAQGQHDRDDQQVLEAALGAGHDVGEREADDQARHRHQQRHLDRRAQRGGVVGIGEEGDVVLHRQRLDHRLGARDELVQAVAEQDGERRQQARGDEDRRRSQQRGGGQALTLVHHPLNDLFHQSWNATSLLPM